MKKYTVEFIGTFFLVLTVGLVSHTRAEFGPFAIAGVLAAMIFAGGHISGAHFNPAVTLAAWLRGKAAPREIVPYWLAQLAAAAAAAGVIAFLFGKVTAELPTHDVGKSLVVEFLFTFALAWAVLNTATAKGTVGNSFYGLAIGLTVLVGAITVGGISGGAFNPAVGLGVVLMGFERVGQLWVYIGADLLGGAAAAAAFRALADGD